MKSLRLDGKLTWRLSVTAERLGISESEVIRRALDDYCDVAPGDSLADALVDYVGAFEGPAGDNSSNAGRRYAEDLHQERLRRQSGAQLRVAETKSSE